MSKTLYVEFRGRGFWTFDVVSGIFIKHLIDAALKRLERRDEIWLSKAVEDWRVDAVVPDHGFFLDDDWSNEQMQTFTELAEAACDELSKRAEIPAEEFTSWPILDDLRIFRRGFAAVSTDSAIRLGRAVI